MAEKPEETAEGGIDRLVQERFFPNTGSPGVFVDVGAARPDFLSMSALFRGLGWRVLAIEPNPRFCELHRARGYEVLQFACGDHDEDGVDFVIVDSHGTRYGEGNVSYESFSSLHIKDSYRALKPDLDTISTKVDLRRLDTILATHAPDLAHIDVLSIDVEGWELEVLAGLDVERYRPRVVVVENLFSSGAYRAFMRRKGYGLWKRSAPNDVYIPDEMAGGQLGAVWMSVYGRLVTARDAVSRVAHRLLPR